MNPSTPSNICCKALGRSAESRDRTSRNKTRRKQKTKTSIENELEIDAFGYLGSICSDRNSMVTGTANMPFRILVNQSCSGIGKLTLAIRLKLRVLKPHKLHTTLRTKSRQRAKTNPQEAHSGSRGKQSI